MNFFDILKACGEKRGEIFAREKGWKKDPIDCTGYGQWVIGVWDKEIYKFVAWYPKEERFVQGGRLRLEPSHLNREWELVTLEQLKENAMATLNPLEGNNLKRVA